MHEYYKVKKEEFEEKGEDWFSGKPDYEDYDYHGLRGQPDGTYKFQPHWALKGSEGDITSNPDTHDPKKDGEDYFDEERIIGKACCTKCKEKK